MFGNYYDWLIFSFRPLGLGAKMLKIFETGWSVKAELN
jgi:hypothetical protein